MSPTLHFYSDTWTFRSFYVCNILERISTDLIVTKCNVSLCVMEMKSSHRVLHTLPDPLKHDTQCICTHSSGGGGVCLICMLLPACCSLHTQVELPGGCVWLTAPPNTHTAAPLIGETHPGCTKSPRGCDANMWIKRNIHTLAWGLRRALSSSEDDI